MSQKTVINMDLVINTEEESVDMKSGLLSMQGVSDAIRYVGESVLAGVIRKKNTKSGRVRTELKKSFKGSYGHNFSVEVSEEKARRVLRKLGNDAFVELIAYVINESLFRETKRLSNNAMKHIEEKGLDLEELSRALRKGALKKTHDVAIKYGLELKVRYKKRGSEKAIIANFNESTARTLSAKTKDRVVELCVTITRFNTRTGNGRLLIKGETETVAFGFKISYAHVGIPIRRKFSKNLDVNNGVSEENWKYLTVRANTMELGDGEVVKYLVKEIVDE